MKLRYISIHMSDQGAYEFLDPKRDKYNLNCRFISNFLSKEVRKLKFDTDGSFKLISVQPSRENLNEVRVLGGKALSIRIEFDIDKYEKLTKNSITDYNLSLLEKGIDELSKSKLIPVYELKAIINNFKEEGCENKWIAKKRRFKDYDIEVLLNCDFDMNSFRLSLVVNRLSSKKNIFNNVVIETLPDENCFDSLFKDVIIKNSKLIITDFQDQPKFEFKLNDIAKGVCIMQVDNSFGIEYSPNNVDKLYPSLI